MATTTPEKPDQNARDRVSARVEPKAERNAMARADQNKQYDLLTAALIGAAVGVSATLLLRGGIRGGSRRAAAIEPALRAARRVGTKGARWARERGEALWDRVPHDDIADTFKGYAETAREAIDRAVDSELRGLQKQLRRQRRRMHL